MRCTEYLQTLTIAAGNKGRFLMPDAGIAAVYATAAVGIAWDFNGVVADLVNTAAWEPLGGFKPAKTSALIIDNTGGGSAVTVAIRCYEEKR